MKSEPSLPPILFEIGEFWSSKSNKTLTLNRPIGLLHMRERETRGEETAGKLGKESFWGRIIKAHPKGPRAHPTPSHCGGAHTSVLACTFGVCLYNFPVLGRSEIARLFGPSLKNHYRLNLFIKLTLLLDTRVIFFLLKNLFLTFLVVVTSDTSSRVAGRHPKP